MTITRNRLRTSCLTLLLAGASVPASADPVVTYTFAPAPGGPAGFVRYSLTVVNFVSNPQLFITGVVVPNGFSLFQLDGSSNIGAPSVNGNQWGFIPPAPPFSDALTYFSPAAAGDIPASAQDDFTFDSPLTPDQFCACDFQVVLIERSQGALAPITAANAPEPSTFGFTATAALIVVGRIRRRRNRRHISRILNP